jgi:hypothetical protein
LPVGTLGLATWLMLLYAGFRLRSPWLKSASPCYLAVVLVSPWAGTWFVLALWIVGGLHCAVVGRWVWHAVRACDVAPPGEEEIVAVVVEERRASERRRRAREILRAQPALAEDLRIGRPDLPRTYNDGGLVDVNHVPVDLLVHALEIPRETADRIVAERELRGGLSVPDDLAIYCGLPMERLAVIRDYLVFPPC